jgi:hypothetical protein
VRDHTRKEVAINPDTIAAMAEEQETRYNGRFGSLTLTVILTNQGNTYTVDRPMRELLAELGAEFKEVKP